MFTKKITSSDAFLDMSPSAQNLYFHLNMEADDEGFVGNPKSIQRICRASDDDLKLLFAKNFVLGFESGVIVIKHFKMHNAIRQDRIKETSYLDEKNKIVLKENFSYTHNKDENEPLEILTDKCPHRLVKDTNLILSNTNLIIKEDLKDFKDLKIEIIDYMNSKLGTNYRYNGNKITSLINARLKEGFEFDDFKYVIDIKFDEWSSDKAMSKYLNYETLFGNKFEKYRNQKNTTVKENIWEGIEKL